MYKTIILKLIIIILGVWSFFLTISAIAVPILAHYGAYELSGKLDKLFIEVCHRQPIRSFWIFNYPIAICCRCLGFYFSFWIFALFLMFRKLKVNFLIFVLISFVAVSDIAINFFWNINTSNIQRFFAGICLGYVTVYLIQFLFRKGEIK